MIIYLLSPVMFHIGKKIEFLFNNIYSYPMCIRDSEDTMLLIMKEILKLDNFEPEPQYGNY